MELHTPTLALVAVFMTAIVGGLMLLAWRRDQSTVALVWWGIGYLLGGTAFALLIARGSVPNVLSVEIANAILLLSYTFLFAGTRSFSGGDTPVTVFLVAPLIWLIAMRVPEIRAHTGERPVIVASLQCVFVALMAHDLWRGRAEPLLSRWPTIILLVTHLALLIVRMAALLTMPIESDLDFLHSNAFGVIAFVAVLYTITFAFLLLSMTKERSELRHKLAASIDPLTGLANRRAFMSEAETLIARCGARAEPMALLLADLDHFKTINDMFGHPTGDRVLTLFAAALNRCVGAGDLVGRIGGEEFAILLAGQSEAAAVTVAQRVRWAFAESARELDGQAIDATVSIGVAATRLGAHDLVGLLGRADKALYRAKAKGRNRVAIFDDTAEVDAPPLAPSATPIRRLAVAAG